MALHFESQNARGSHLPLARASSENVQVNVICAYCGTEHHKPLRWFRENSRLNCEGCGYEIALQNEQLRAAINELYPVMSRLRRSSRAA